MNIERPPFALLTNPPKRKEENFYPGIDQENQNPNLQVTTSKVRKVSQKPVSECQTAPRTSQRFLKQRFEVHSKLLRLIQKQEKRAENGALLEKNARQFALIEKGLRTVFHVPLNFRLDNEGKASAAEFWKKSHYENREQHLIHARLLLQKFYERAPEMVENQASRGALELTAYLVAAKAGEDTYEVECTHLRNILTSQDRALLTLPRFLQMEQVFLMTVGYGHLNFDLLSDRPPIMQWKEAVAKGLIPPTQSFECFNFDLAYQIFQRVAGLDNPSEEDLQKSQIAWNEYLQAHEKLLIAKKIGETFVNQAGEATMRRSED